MSSRLTLNGPGAHDVQTRRRNRWEWTFHRYHSGADTHTHDERNKFGVEGFTGADGYLLCTILHVKVNTLPWVDF